MGRRVTVDQNGVVVLVEAVPARETGAKTSAKAKKTKKGVGSTSRRSWTGQITISQGKPSYQSKSRCPECSATVQTARLAEHRRKVHGPGGETPKNGDSRAGVRQLSPSGKPMVRCPACTSMVREDKLGSHRKKVHGLTSKSSGTPSQKKSTARKSSPPRSTHGRSVGHSGGSTRSDLARETLREMMEETRFGDKGLGQTVRDNGRFGSVPLYDDYAEESNPD